MAKIIQTQLVVTVSKVVKDSSPETSVKLSESEMAQMEEVISAQLDSGLAVEVISLADE